MRTFHMSIEQEEMTMPRTIRSIAIVALSPAGAQTALRIVNRGMTADVYLSAHAAKQQRLPASVRCFSEGIHQLTTKLFNRYDGLVYVMPLGIVVRSIAPYVTSKLCDPAVVTVDVAGRWVIATLSGHEGGANMLASDIAGLLHTEPVITTSTEAVKTVIAGVGCRKGAAAEMIETAIHNALTVAGCTIDELRVVATVDAKQHETGIVSFCQKYAVPLRILSREEIKEARIQCNESALVKKTLGIGAVAVPCALLGGKKTALIKEKMVWKQVTVALAREHCMW